MLMPDFYHVEFCSTSWRRKDTFQWKRFTRQIWAKYAKEAKNKKCKTEIPSNIRHKINLTWRAMHCQNAPMCAYMFANCTQRWNCKEANCTQIWTLFLQRRPLPNQDLLLLLLTRISDPCLPPSLPTGPAESWCCLRSVDRHINLNSTAHSIWKCSVQVPSSSKVTSTPSTQVTPSPLPPLSTPSQLIQPKSKHLQKEEETQLL